MKKLTLEQFEQLIKNSDWKHTSFFGDEATECVKFEQYDVDGQPELLDAHSVCGGAWLESEHDGIKIIYTENYSYKYCDSESFATNTDFDEPWSIIGAIVVDDDGDEWSMNDIVDGFPTDFPSVFSDIDYSEIVDNIDQSEDVGEIDGELITVYVDNQPDIRFSGQLIGRASSKNHDSSRWTVLEIYQTKSGKYICSQQGCTKWVGEKTRYNGLVCTSKEALIEFFGYGWLAKELYSAANIDTATIVE